MFSTCYIQATYCSSPQKENLVCENIMTYKAGTSKRYGSPLLFRGQDILTPQLEVFVCISHWKVYLAHHIHCRRANSIERASDPPKMSVVTNATWTDNKEMDRTMSKRLKVLPAMFVSYVSGHYEWVNTLILATMLNLHVHSFLLG